ncbi:MAG: site-specific integrase, partial [Alphaproteobacteria bacterium]|nr:site-specific integrase [Alphaproteobacteria bacterium]
VRQKNIGTASRSFIKKTQAIKWALEQEERIERGVFGSIETSEVTLGELLKRYSQQITPAKRGAETEQRRLNRLINDSISDYSIEQLTSKTLASFRDRRLLDGQRACEYDLILIRHCLKVAMSEWGLMLSVNPVDQIKKPSSPKARERRLNDGEYERLEAASKLTQNAHIWPIVVFAIETGMRRGEILGLTWDNIDLKRRTVFLPLTKNGSSREVPLSTKAVCVLQQQRTRTGISPFPVNSNAFRLAWDRLRGRADLNDLRFHDLRHEAISRFFEMGLTVPEVALISGHKDVKMLFRYTHLKVDSVVSKLA